MEYSLAGLNRNTLHWDAGTVPRAIAERLTDETVACLRAVLSVNHEMIEEIHFPYIDWRKPGYASLPACRHARQACWKPKRAWN
jgi:hypothetical protein